MGGREAEGEQAPAADLLGIEDLTGFVLIGSGGSGAVYSAWDEAFGRRVAVKVLRAVDPDDRRRFERERRIMGHLSAHPNIVTAYRAGFTGTGAPYLVMEHAPDGSLQDVLRRSGPLPWPVAVDHTIAAATGLAHAHASGVLHKDVKPANILLIFGVAKLSDFGIAALRGRTVSEVAYTLAHSAPETFAHGRDARDERSDLYSIASTLYELLRGAPAFDAGDEQDSQLAYLYRIMGHRPPPLPDSVPPAIQELVARGMAKDPADRPATVEMFAAELRSLRIALDPTTPAAPSVRPPPPAPARLEAPTESTGDGRATPPPAGGPSGRPGRPVGRRRWARRGAVVLAALALAGVVAAEAVRRSGGTAGGDPATVHILGAENGADATAIQAALDRFGRDNGLTVVYEQSFEVPARLRELAASGESPDAVLVLQPGQLPALDATGEVRQLPEATVAAVDAAWGRWWLDTAAVDGRYMAAPTAAFLKSQVWYRPARFAALGYIVPTSWDDLVALTRTAAADGNTPWCLGFESGPDSGWAFTDWVEQLVLDRYGPEVYDRWVAGDVAFDDRRIRAVFDDLDRLWAPENTILGTRLAADARAWDDLSGLLDDQCLMVAGPSILASRFPDDPALFEPGSTEAVAAFPLPGGDQGPTSAVVGGAWIAALDDRPQVWSVVDYLVSAGYADDRQQVYAQATGVPLRPSGVLSPAPGQDRGLHLPLERSMLDALTGSPVRRYDGADVMAPDRAAAFRREGARFAAGRIPAGDAAAMIDQA